MDAARGADLVTTDVWTSMGFESENEERKRDFEDWQVDGEMMKAAKKDALFMHCLPAHRGEEVAAEVIDGPQSVVWDEAENRLHAQKALLELGPKSLPALRAKMNDATVKESAQSRVRHVIEELATPPLTTEAP